MNIGGYYVMWKSFYTVKAYSLHYSVVSCAFKTLWSYLMHRSNMRVTDNFMLPWCTMQLLQIWICVIYAFWNCHVDMEVLLLELDLCYGRFLRNSSQDTMFRVITVQDHCSIWRFPAINSMQNMCQLWKFPVKVIIIQIMLSKDYI